jgi:hypothetical protein
MAPPNQSTFNSGAESSAWWYELGDDGVWRVRATAGRTVVTQAQSAILAQMPSTAWWRWPPSSGRVGAITHPEAVDAVLPRMTRFKVDGALGPTTVAMLWNLAKRDGAEPLAAQLERDLLARRASPAALRYMIWLAYGPGGPYTLRPKMRDVLVPEDAESPPWDRPPPSEAHTGHFEVRPLPFDPGVVGGGPQPWPSQAAPLPPAAPPKDRHAVAKAAAVGAGAGLLWLAVGALVRAARP